MNSVDSISVSVQRVRPPFSLSIRILVVSVLCSGIASATQQDWIQSWVFNGRTEASVRQGLLNQADQKLNQLEEHCRLTDEQRAKLKLAANGDVKRFFTEVAIMRRETESINQQDQNAVQTAWTRVRPLTERMQSGIFGDQSLFGKVMSSTLDKSQIEEYEKVVREQSERRQHALVLSLVTTLEKSVPMVADQREKLIALLDAQTIKPLRRQDIEAYVAYAKLSRISDEELEKLFDKEQVKVLKAIRERYAAIAQMVFQN